MAETQARRPNTTDPSQSVSSNPPSTHAGSTGVGSGQISPQTQDRENRITPANSGESQAGDAGEK